MYIAYGMLAICLMSIILEMLDARKEKSVDKEDGDACR